MTTDEVMNDGRQKKHIKKYLNLLFGLESKIGALDS